MIEKIRRLKSEIMADLERLGDIYIRIDRANEEYLAT